MSGQKFSFEERQKAWRDFDQTYFDIIVVGGGINGAGIARDACSRGMKVALVEANDFAFGTSSRSSKLIHGGIRYLENLEFPLVFEALSERALLFKIAPHLVHPLKFLLPVYKKSRVPLWKLRVGLWLYDGLALFRTPKIHEFLSAETLKSEYPQLQTQDLLGGFIYFDGYMDDDRLVVETLRSAYQTQLLSAANYVKACEFWESEQGCHLRVQNQLTGEFKTIIGRQVVACVGPWTDILRRNILKSNMNKLRPSKGIHITFHRERWSLPTAVVMGVEERIVFAIPRHDMVIVGTTDTDFSEDPGKVRVEAEDINYLMQVVRSYFSGAQLSECDIIAAYAGVRPLVKDHAQSVGKTSREHVIWYEGGVWWVAGGKYTTYRKIAEEAVTECLSRFPLELQIAFAESDTKRPLNDLVPSDYLAFKDDLVTELLAKTQSLSTMEAEKLVDRFGPESLRFPERYGSKRGYWEYEIFYAWENTMCLSLRDFYFRRTPLFLGERDHGLGYRDRFLKVFPELGQHYDQSHFEEQWFQLNREIENGSDWRSVLKR
ncbi:MAG: glycerol-3-phosphate dehydrogenase/oxidase [Bdellovibrionaceae bacterium]|nr:glycerol-3-phosphate dehydrogenase/oxidase [Pseudobdellovibrionaceae bacterium]MDW8190527.1 glycerol-3-phosphate dehydrogenase/oxidase [Pseudobdellovibrionaceae bacterium]